MLDFDVSPYNYLPLQKDDLFDLSCEYLVSLFEQISMSFEYLTSVSEQLTRQLFAGGDTKIAFGLVKRSFRAADNLINNYAKIVKCAKLSLGEDVGKVKSKFAPLKSLGYVADDDLHKRVLLFKNTQQHFEERLQDFDNQIDPFVKLLYSGVNATWEITFGKGGYRFNQRRDEVEERFDIKNLSFQSYKLENKRLVEDRVSIGGLWADTLQIIELVKANIQSVIDENGICCPPIRYLGITITPGAT